MEVAMKRSKFLQCRSVRREILLAAWASKQPVERVLAFMAGTNLYCFCIAAEALSQRLGVCWAPNSPVLKLADLIGGWARWSDYSKTALREAVLDELELASSL
jgi:hypothetical protein